MKTVTARIDDDSMERLMKMAEATQRSRSLSWTSQCNMGNLIMFSDKADERHSPSMPFLFRLNHSSLQERAISIADILATVPEQAQEAIVNLVAETARVMNYLRK